MCFLLQPELKWVSNWHFFYKDKVRQVNKYSQVCTLSFSLLWGPSFQVQPLFSLLLLLLTAAMQLLENTVFVTAAPPRWFFTRWHRLISLLLLSPLLASPFILITRRVRLLFGAAKSSPYLITMFAWRPSGTVLLLGLRWVIWGENRSPLNQCIFSALLSDVSEREKNGFVMNLLTTKSIFRTWLDLY